MRIRTLTIVGVGLIGGSIGLAAKRRKIADWVVGIGRQWSTLDRAFAAGAVDETSLDLAASVRHADIAVFCTPVDCIARQVLATAPGCSPGTLLTDAGSTKATIVKGIEGRLPDEVAFVGSHPLAGSEKRGPENADADLFQDRLTIVTQTPRTLTGPLERTIAFWRALGSQVRVMDPDEHDQALAHTSHLPHLVAAALASTLRPELYELTATGFRDTTRVAAGDPSIWTAIFAENRLPVIAALELLNARLSRFRQALDAGDWAAVNCLLAEAKKVRDALGN
jgi:prephenate dehydrogenase